MGDLLSYLDNLLLIYNRNNKGPRTDPYGIPHDVLHFVDDTPFTMTICCLLSKSVRSEPFIRKIS